MRKAKKGMMTGARSWRGKVLQSRHHAIDVMGEDQAAQQRHFDGVVIGFGLLVGNGEQGQRRARLAVPMRFDGGQFGGLVFAGC